MVRRLSPGDSLQSKEGSHENGSQRVPQAQGSEARRDQGPRDPASGLPTGKRQHKPIVITKELDKSSPLLYNALVNNENIPEWELQFWTPQLSAAGGVGAEKQHYTIKLTNANIASIAFRML